MADVELRRRDVRKHPVGRDFSTHSFNGPGGRVAPYPADTSRTIRIYRKRNRNVVWRIERISGRHVVACKHARIGLLDFNTFKIGVRALIPRHRKVILIVLSVIKDTCPVPHRSLSGPDFHRHFGDVCRQHVRSKVQRTRITSIAAQHHGGVAFVEGDRRADGAGTGASDGIVVVAVEAPTVHKFRRRRGGSDDRERKCRRNSKRTVANKFFQHLFPPLEL